MKYGVSLCLGVYLALAAVAAQADTLLFDSHSVLEISVPVDFKSLCRPREDSECDYVPTTLDYVDEHGEQQSLPIEIKIRGGWRSLTKNCSAPLLFIRFDQQHTGDTPFEGQFLLPLTTHCGRGLSLEQMDLRQRNSDWEQYLLKEYLAHRIYNVITGVSLNARLVHISYPNPDKPKRRIENYAFFTEHFESAAERNNAKHLDRGSFDYRLLDTSQADLLALFQFMIGNTDWSIARERNTIIIQRPDMAQLPVPYDFDMSGLVNTHYAGPAPRLPIESVQERYYLGYCHPDVDWDALFSHYLNRQQEIMALMDETPGLDRKSLKHLDRFLDGFFRTLNSEDERMEAIVNNCQPWPPGPEDHMRPFEK